MTEAQGRLVVRFFAITLGVTVGAVGFIAAAGLYLISGEPEPCVPSVVFHDGFAGHIDTRDVCGEGRIPGEPISTGGYLGMGFKVSCACPEEPTP